MGIEEFCLILLDNESGELRVWDDKRGLYEVIGDVTFRLGEGIAGRVAESGEAILVPDAADDGRFMFYKGRLPEIGSFLSVPVKAEGGRVIGVLNLHKREARAFRDSDKVFFSAVAHNLGHALERARRFEDAQRESMYDDLTRRYNRRFLLDSLRREILKAKRTGDRLSVIMIDIDHFKHINDTHGHQAGDRVLAQLACALRTSMRQSDIVARLGGEEFVVVLPATGKEGAMLAAEKFRALVEENVFIDEERSEKITITAGVATWPGDGDTHEILLDTADRHIYVGKHCGRNRVIGCVGGDDLEGTGDERRRQSRYRTGMRIVQDGHCFTALEVCDGHDAWRPCLLLDVSRNGFSSTVDFKPVTGEKYRVRAVSDSVTRPSDCLSVQVAHARRIGGERWLIGVTIDAESTELWEGIYSLLFY